jgi:hypothetical protein
MLQLSENKGRRNAQIAKKFKNGLLHFSRLFHLRSNVKGAAVLRLNTPPPPPIGIFRRPVLPWIQRDQPASSNFSAHARGRGE